MENQVSQRIREFAKAERISVREFEKECGLYNGYVKDLQSMPTVEKQKAIHDRFPYLNMVWLLLGEGLMYGDIPTPVGNIRLWNDIAATGGGITLYEDSDTRDYSLINVPGCEDCTDAVKVVGDSMYPAIKSGQIIVLKRWTETFIEYGNIYLIVTNSGNRMVKYIRKGKDDAHIICASENKQYEDIDVCKADILALYRVRGGIVMY